MKKFTFTMDDNILFFKDIAERKPKSIFENTYLAMLLRLHRQFNLKVQLNLFYQPDFEEKLATTFSALCEQGFESVFFEEIININ